MGRMHRGPTPSKMMLALSGGGYRAMLFHVGALWKLNQIGQLGHLVHVSSVSGGSITAGVLAARWEDLTFVDGSASNYRKLVADPLMRLASRTLDVSAALSGMVPFYSASRTVQRLYRRHLFLDMLLGDLPRHPRFTFNATNLQTGAVWTYERNLMGDQALGITSSEKIPLAKAVAASSAFPPFLSPVILRNKDAEWQPYPPGLRLRSYDDVAVEPARVPVNELTEYRKHVVLADGGVADNLGSVAAWGGEGDLCISDGGGILAPRRKPRRNWASQLFRVVSLTHDQPSKLRTDRAKAEMADRDEGKIARGPRRHGDGAVWRVQWPPESHDGDPEFPSHPGHEREWERLAMVPTRLKAMTPDRQRHLVNWGYVACNRSLPYINRLFFVGDHYGSAFEEEDLPFPETGSVMNVGMAS